MKIGLTGGTGFIGQYLIRDYCDLYKFIVPTSDPNMEKESTKAVRYIHSDYSCESFCQAFQNCDIIVHLGACVCGTAATLLSLDPLEKNPVTSYYVFSAAENLGIKNIINISTCGVYSQEQNKLAKEEDICHPLGTYGTSKLAVEELAAIFNRLKGMNIVTLRLAQILGYREKVKGGFYSMLLNNSIASKPLTVYGDGRVERDVLYVKDVTYAIDLVIRKFPDIHGIFNIGMGRPVSNMELAEAFCKAFSNPGGIVRIPIENEEISCWGLDITHARNTLGFVPQYDVYEMANDIYQEYQMATAKEKTK